MGEAGPRPTSALHPTVPTRQIETDQKNISIPKATPEDAIAGTLASPHIFSTPKSRMASEHVVLVNQDGSGMKTIALPESGFSASSPSPTGEWILFYTTSSDPPKEGSIDDLALHLRHLPDGEVHDVTVLLPKDYPENIQKIAGLAQGNDMEDFAGVPLKQIMPIMKQSFKTILLKAAWSPGGHTLAFSGAMDGPSTDLYLYDLPSGKISQLSSGLRNIDFIHWFPKETGSCMAALMALTWAIVPPTM